MKRAKQSQSPASTPQLSTSKKYRSAGQAAGPTSSPNTTNIPPTNPQPKMLGESRFSPSNTQTSTNPNPFPYPNYKTATQTTANIDDRSSVSDNDSCTSPCGIDRKGPEPSPAPGKKTRGRVKIEMQYIQNKLRRYTTFSKRKSGMMKKAYELSTLTGTQVMLLVASETGHVYTFATPKLQPMITSDAGKALIQTCLHTPDPPQAMGDYDMRMCATGYEETELGYSISDDDAFKTGLETSPPQMVSAQGQQQHMPQMMGNSIISLPPSMMQVPFQLADHQQSMMQSGASYPNPVQTMSPHTNSPPPSYSPSHPTSPPRSAYPTSPTSAIPYSQSSHMTHPHMLMEDHLASGSPLRKTPPENHYLPHHQYDRSPSTSPMGPIHYPVRSRSPPQGYTQQSGSPTNHSPIGHL